MCSEHHACFEVFGMLTVLYRLFNLFSTRILVCCWKEFTHIHRRQTNVIFIIFTLSLSLLRPLTLWPSHIWAIGNIPAAKYLMQSSALRRRSLKLPLTLQIPREKVWRASELYLSPVLIHFLPGTPAPPPGQYIKPTGFHVGVSSYSHSVVKAPAHRHGVFEMPARYLFPLSSLLLYVHVHAIGATREIIAVLGSVLTSVYFTLRLCCFGICWTLAP